MQRCDGLHPSWRGALILSINIDRALTPFSSTMRWVQARQKAVSQPVSLVESATSTVSLVGCWSYQSHWNKDLLHSCHYWKRLCSHLKIGLLNVRSLTSKAVIVYELTTDHNLDVIGLTETWWIDCVKIGLFPPGYTSDHIPPAHPAKAEVLLTFTTAKRQRFLSF